MNCNNKCFQSITEYSSFFERLQISWRLKYAPKRENSIPIIVLTSNRSRWATTHTHFWTKCILDRFIENEKSCFDHVLHPIKSEIRFLHEKFECKQYFFLYALGDRFIQMEIESIWIQIEIRWVSVVKQPEREKEKKMKKKLLFHRIAIDSNVLKMHLLLWLRCKTIFIIFHIT